VASYCVENCPDGCNIGVSINTSIWVEFACDLGIYIDSDLLMRTYLQRTVSRCFAVLWQLRQIHCSVPTDTFQTMLVSLVLLTRLDFGSSVHGWCSALPDISTPVGAKRGELRAWRTTSSIWPNRWALGLPPPVARSGALHFKIAVLSYVLSYAVLPGQKPQYPAPVTRVAVLPGRRSLGFVGTNRLIVPPVKISTVGSRAFPVVGSQIWNDLPEDVTSAV